MERINDYGIPEMVCDQCEARIYESDDLTIDHNKHYHGSCFLEMKGYRHEDVSPVTFPHDHLPTGSSD